MDTTFGEGRQSRLLAGGALLVAAVFTVLMLSPNALPSRASAPSVGTFGPACGAAVIDGRVNSAEWSSASTQTSQMYSPSGSAPFTVTLRVMNSRSHLYLGITINDDEYSTYGKWLPEGDAFRVDFDNDHSGSLFTPGDDVLIISAGAPQFEDCFISGGTSAASDAGSGGTADGSGVASRIGNLNHFEMKHPLCSGDSRDFCLHPMDVVGFRLEYLDAEADGSFGGNQFYPSYTAEADIVIGVCPLSDVFVYLPFIRK